MIRVRDLLLFIIFFALLSCSDKKQTNEPVSPKRTQAPAVNDELEPAADASRTEWQNPELVISKLGDLSKKTVVDIGAGSGYFTFKLAEIANRVIALEIDPNALEYIEEQKQILGAWTNNIQARLTPPDVPNLLPNEADMVLIVNTYTLLPDRVAYMERLLDGMKLGAELVLVDFKNGNIPVGPSDESKISPKEVRRELRIAGFRQIKIDKELLTYQYVITAKK